MRRNRPEHLYEQILIDVSESNMLAIIAKSTAQNYEKDRWWEILNNWGKKKSSISTKVILHV